MDIVEELRRDRENGAKRLVSEYKAGLMTLARRFLVNESDAEELVNATFAKVVANIDTYLEQSAFFAWMCQILTNEFRDSVRRKSRKMEVCPDVLPDMADERAEEGIFRDLDHSLLRDAIETLPNEMKEAIMLHYIAEQPIPVVARFLRLPVSTVKWRLHVARQELARRLGAKVGDAVKKPGAKALLIALALAALTAVGATVASLVGDAAIGSRPQPAAEGSREPPAIGGRLQPAAESRMPSAAESAQEPPATGGRPQPAADTSTSPTTGGTMNTTKTARTLAAASLALTSAFTTAAPAGVAKFIEYVQTDGNNATPGEYVLLDYVPTANSVVEAEISILAANQPHTIFCARGSATNERTFTLFHVANTGLRWDYDRTTGEYETGLAAATRGVVRCAPDGLWLNGVKSSAISVSPHDYTPANKMMLFASYTCATTATPAATGNYAKMRLYSFKAWDDNGATLRVDLRPCIDTDGKVALYDAVTGVLYYNKKSGKKFTAGPEVTFDGLLVTGSPMGYGAPAPAYGLISSLETGTTYTFSAPAVWTNAAATIAATCQGFTLRLADGTTVASSATQTNLTYSSELEGATLTWLWAPHKTITVSNFDEDLATVYVNGRPVADGEKCFLAPGESTATLELRDFRSDWYFAYAPDSQTDRSLALKRWEGLLAGADATANPVTFAVDADLAITPNIDCKGHVWTAYGTTVISNATFRMSAGSFNPATRSLTLGTCNAYYSGDKVMDFAMRVDYFGTNYTITAIGNSPVNGHGAVEMRVPRRLASIGTLVSSGTTLTNIVGLSETALSTIPGLAFDQAPLHGPIMNYIPEGVTSVGHYAYRRGGGQTQFMLHGPLVLPHVTSFGVDAFRGCAYVTELCATSPDLTTLSSGAFLGCPRLMNVTLASPILASVDVKAFTAITNLAYLSAPPTQAVLDRLVATVAASDGGKALTMRVPLGTPGWWDLVSEPTAAEVAAGLPEGCLGVYATAGGERKGWIFAADDVDASLVVTDMSQIGNAGYEIHADLTQGDTLTLSREGFTACDLQHFNRATGAWETFETKQGDSFTYTHDGQLTRARWKINGFALNLSSDCYGGTFTVSGATPVAGDNVYASGAVLTVTASGRAEHPTSHFTAWTAGVLGEATNSAAITLTMDSDKTLAAAFAPDEWYYDPSTRKITDGEWMSAAAVTLDATAKTVKSGAFASPAGHYSLWLDLSLPVLVETDPASAYQVTELTFADDGLIRKLRLGTRFKSFATSAFRYTTVLERLDGMGSSSMTAMPYYFFMLADSCPLHFQTYEANDFLPETLVTLYEAWYAGGPYLVGTLRLPNLTSYRTDGAFPNRTAGVTNLYLTCETLASFPYKLFHGMKLQELTIGSTNLATAVSDSFSGAASTLERLNFLAHAPATAALDNILASYNARTTTSAKPLEIRCSKYAPGWRELAAAVDRSSEEWRARPAGTWGIYQTAAGKRFYLVQRDSKYDKNPFTLIIMR